MCELDEISPQSAIFSPGALSNAVTIYPVHISVSEHEQNREVHNTVKLTLQSSSVLFFKVTNRDVHVQLNDQWHYAVFSEVCREQCARQCFQYMYTCSVYIVQCAVCTVCSVKSRVYSVRGSYQVCQIISTSQVGSEGGARA